MTSTTAASTGQVRSWGNLERLEGIWGGAMDILNKLGLVSLKEHKSVIEQNRMMVDEALMSIATWQQPRASEMDENLVLVSLTIPKRHLINLGSTDPHVQSMVMDRLLRMLGRQFNAGIGALMNLRPQEPEAESGSYL